MYLGEIEIGRYIGVGEILERGRYPCGWVLLEW